MTPLVQPERARSAPALGPAGLPVRHRDRNSLAVVPHVHAPSRWIAPAFLLFVDIVVLLVAVAIAGASPLTLAYAAVAVVALAASKAYRVRIAPRALDEVPWLVGRLALAAALLAPVALLTGGADALLWVALAGVGLLVVGRGISFASLRRLRRRGLLVEPAVILGAGEIGAELARSLQDHRDFGVQPVGFLDSVSGKDLPLPVLGDVSELGGILERYDVRRVIVAFGPVREAELVDVLRTAVQHHVEVHIVPRFFDCGVAPEGPDIDDVRGIPLYRVRRAALRAPAWMLKRVLDVSVSGAALVLAAPILALVALGVKLSSPGPILFRQRRVGQDGREIDVLKFRTLRQNDDSDTQWSVDGDERLTPIGRFLRRTSLDELPQLWGVVRGDMSLVGPRPERPFFVRRFSADVYGYKDRHRLPVGLTGWAQVHGLRGDTSIEERARFDNHYIEHWSLWRDFVVLARTVVEVVRGARTPPR
jgi:exopolysaccharide biosynthesis polyprenyl glycosylphosphotransferase